MKRFALLLAVLCPIAVQGSAQVASAGAVGSTSARAGAVGSTSARAGGTHDSTALDVQPFPGTPGASPQTEIAFPALSPSQIKLVVVSGSVTGSHAGHLVALGKGHGSAFMPDRAFANGERVSVRAKLSSAAAGTASGAPGATRISWQFGVGATVPISNAQAASLAGESTGFASTGATIRHDVRDPNGFTHSFRSIGWIHPPLVNKSGSEPDPSQGDIFGDAQNTVQPGPIILDPQGNLVYFQPTGSQAAYNTQIQQYQGQQVLTYWQGYAGRYGVGQDVIYDHHYRLVKTVNAGNGYHADEHEFYITPQGNAFISIYNPIKVNLSSIGGSANGTLVDSIIQEINIATGKVLWEWHSYGHVHIAESYAGKPTAVPYDFFHLNSIQQLSNGNLLVSARQTWTVYEINMKTGKIVWNLGGKNSSFKIGKGANFEWQHDAVMQPNGTITVFDDGDGYYRVESQSRALDLSLNYSKKTVSLVRSLTNKPSLLSDTQGSVQVLPDGNTFVGWGNRPYFTEFDRYGRQLFTAWFAGPLQSYRGYRSSWWGQPVTPPNVAVWPGKTVTWVWASWNGATDVSRWRVLAGPTPSRLSSVGVFNKGYFETEMKVPSTQPYFAVQALGASGGVRATSAVVSR